MASLRADYLLMGTWGTGLFADDTACDIRGYYRDLLEDRVEDDEATRLTLVKFRTDFDEADGVALLVLAVAQSSLGRLDPGIRDQALAVIDRGADLDAWELDSPKLVGKRRAVLEKARQQLIGPQPARKLVRPPRRVLSGLAAGEILAFRLPSRVALLRVVHVRPHRLGESPILEELDFEGTQVPSQDVLEALAPKTTNTIAWKSPLSPDTRLHAFVAADRIDWQAAGFEKVAIVSARAGDPEAPLPNHGVSWATLAANYRRRYAS